MQKRILSRCARRFLLFFQCTLIFLGTCQSEIAYEFYIALNLNKILVLHKKKLHAVIYEDIVMKHLKDTFKSYIYATSKKEMHGKWYNFLQWMKMVDINISEIFVETYQVICWK